MKKLITEQLAPEFRIPHGRSAKVVNMKKTPLKRKEIIITSTDDLLNIKQQSPLLKRPRRMRFSLQLPHLSIEERNHYEKKLTKIYSACGCESGAALGLISLITFILIVSTYNAVQWNWILILYGMGIFSLGVFIGKVTGLTITNIRKKRLIKMITNIKEHK